MIVNIRGTHGSGKSTVVKKIMEKYGSQPEEFDDRGKPLTYRVRIKGAGRPQDDLIVIGRYDIACGGCDSIQPYALIWPLVEKYGTIGYNVLFEGALVSSSYGNIGRSSEVFGGDFVFAFIDTPLETCLKRIAARRAAKGNFEPLNPKNTSTKFEHVHSSIPKIRDEFKRHVVILDHKKPVVQTMKLYGVNIRKEP